MKNEAFASGALKGVGGPRSEAGAASGGPGGPPEASGKGPPSSSGDKRRQDGAEGVGRHVLYIAVLIRHILLRFRCFLSSGREKRRDEEAASLAVSSGYVFGNCDGVSTSRDDGEYYCFPNTRRCDGKNEDERKLVAVGSSRWKAVRKMSHLATTGKPKLA